MYVEVKVTCILAVSLLDFQHHFVAYNLYWKVMLSIIKSKFLEGDSHIKDGLSSSLKLVYGELALMKFCHVFKTDDEVFKHVYSLLQRSVSVAIKSAKFGNIFICQLLN